MPTEVRPRLDFGRQTGIINPDVLDRTPVTVVGCGGIGSPMVLALAKMGVSTITVYDDDTVEPHNLPNQLYRFPDLGKAKVEALRDICRDFAGIEITIHQERFTDQAVSGILILAVDSMEVRKSIWDAQGKLNPNLAGYIEARMGGEQALVYTLPTTCDPEQNKWYETTFFTDADAIPIPCTERSIIYNVFWIAGIIANNVKRLANGQQTARQLIVDCKNSMVINLDTFGKVAGQKGS